MSIPGRGRGAFVAAFLAAACAVGLAASSAFAVAETIIAADPGGVNSYSQATYTMDQGDRPVLQNNGPDNQHDVFSRANGPDGALLFKSDTIGPGQSSTLNGTQYLTQGTYAFICNVHPLEMSANLQVSGAGAAVARPKVDVTLGGGKLAKLASKGKVPVTVKAVTQADGVEVVLKLGKATIGTQGAFNLAAGQSRKLSVKLSKSGKSKLGKKDKAAIKATGEVPFGAPDSAKKTYK
jgi:plastocyanin